MNRYKQLFNRIPENGNLERRILSIPDAPREPGEAHPFVRFAVIAAAACVLIFGGIFATQYMTTPSGGSDVLFVPGATGTGEPDAVKTPGAPAGDLIINDDDLLYTSGSRRSFASWAEARAAATFDLREPTVLPKDAYWFSEAVVLFQTGGEHSYPGAEIMYGVDIGDSISLAVVLFQYYLGPNGNVVLANDRETRSVTVGDTEVLYYTFGYENTYQTPGGSASEWVHDSIIVLHWIQDDVLFRILAACKDGPSAVYGVSAGFTPDDLLPMAESLIAQARTVYYTRDQLMQFYQDTDMPQYHTEVRQQHGIPFEPFGQLCENSFYYLIDERRVCSSCGYIFTTEQDIEAGLTDPEAHVRYEAPDN
jgi:hypothetical protein